VQALTTSLIRSLHKQGGTCGLLVSTLLVASFMQSSVVETLWQLHTLTVINFLHIYICPVSILNLMMDRLAEIRPGIIKE